MNRLTRSMLIAVFLLPAAYARAQEEPTPVPGATATPEAAAGTPAPTATPETVETPQPEATPEATPAPVDYLAGVAASKPGPHPLTVGVDLGVHLFSGAGWTTRTSDDYEGGSIAGIVTYDLDPLLSLVATAGGNSATHIQNPDANTQITTTLSSWYGDAGLRISTPPRPVRLWLEAAVGAYAASQQVQTATGAFQSSSILSTRGGLCGHAGVGGSYYVAQGLFRSIRQWTWEE